MCMLLIQSFTFFVKITEVVEVMYVMLPSALTKFDDERENNERNTVAPN